jgi:hypothetical protein
VSFTLGYPPATDGPSIETDAMFETSRLPYQQ